MYSHHCIALIVIVCTWHIAIGIVDVSLSRLSYNFAVNTTIGNVTYNQIVSYLLTPVAWLFNNNLIFFL